jgi:hypothetical protein
MKYKPLIILLYFGYRLETMYRNLKLIFFAPTPSFLAIEKLQNHLIFEFSISYIAFLEEFRQLKKRLSTSILG